MQRTHCPEWQWLFTEAGHGKDPADGVGAAIKRNCDDVVSSGGTVVSVDDVVAAVQSRCDNKVRLFKVSSEDIDRQSRYLAAAKLRDMKGISKAHQVVGSNQGVVFRELACNSPKANIRSCQCHKAKVLETSPSVQSNDE